MGFEIWSVYIWGIGFSFSHFHFRSHFPSHLSQTRKIVTDFSGHLPAELRELRRGLSRAPISSKLVSLDFFSSSLFLSAFNFRRSRLRESRFDLKLEIRLPSAFQELRSRLDYSFYEGICSIEAVFVDLCSNSLFLNFWLNLVFSGFRMENWLWIGDEETVVKLRRGDQGSFVEVWRIEGILVEIRKVISTRSFLLT